MAKSKEADIKTYQWDPTSLITRMDARNRGKSESVAYLYTASPDADLPTLHALREEFHAKGWSTSSDIREGKPVLRVQGLKNPQELIDLLQNGNYAKGDISASIVKNDKPKPFWDNIKSHSLRASGIVYSIGNALYMLGGYKRNKDLNQIGTGIAFASGDVAVAVFGGKDEERQFKILLTRMTKEWKKNGIELPKGVALAAEISTKGDSLAEKTYDIIHENINKIKAAAEVIGGYYYFKHGKDKKLVDKQITAVIFSLGFGSSIFIKEKKTDPEKLKNAGPLAKAWAFVQESPLRIAGWSGLSNTVLTTSSAYKERKRELAKPANIRTDFYKYDFATAGTMLVANNLYALSHNAAGGEIKSDSLINDIYGITAQAINHLAPEKREKAIKVAADFLGERVDIKDFSKQVEAKLREHITHERDENPWSRSLAETVHAPGISDAKLKRPLPAPIAREGNWADNVNRTEESARSASL